MTSRLQNGYNTFSKRLCNFERHQFVCCHTPLWFQIPRVVSGSLPPSYRLYPGSNLDRALLLKFMQQTYEEMELGESYSHLALTVDQYLSQETPLWWVEVTETGISRGQRQPVACLWMGTAIDQLRGDRHAHIFLLYVVPEHRRRGLGTALIRQAEEWAKIRGDRQIGLQVFQSNQAAVNLYQNLGYQTQSLWMVKPLR